MDGPDHPAADPLILLGLLLSGHLLCRMSVHCMNGYDIVSPMPMQHSLLVLVSTPVPLLGLCLSRLPVTLSVRCLCG